MFANHEVYLRSASLRMSKKTSFEMENRLEVRLAQQKENLLEFQRYIFNSNLNLYFSLYFESGYRNIYQD